MMVERGEMVGRDEVELGTLRSVVDGLWAHGGRPALVAVGEEGVEIWTYGELAWRLSRRGPWSCRWMSSSVMARSMFVLNRILSGDRAACGWRTWRTCLLGARTSWHRTTSATWMRSRWPLRSTTACCGARTWRALPSAIR